jgi:hypothetical protein
MSIFQIFRPKQDGFVRPMFPNAVPAYGAPETLLCSLVIDAEENFDWNKPIPGLPFSTACMLKAENLVSLVSAYGVVPTFLLTYPILQDKNVVKLLARQYARGECKLGIQLHSWVNPPFSDHDGIFESFVGNLPKEQEAAKLDSLCSLFKNCFGEAPKIFRSGRYGFGPNTSSLLEERNFEIDTSLAPRSSFLEEGGPDFSESDQSPFWFGNSKRILEVPLCRSVVGWGGLLSSLVYDMASRNNLSTLVSVMARSRFAERITLSPEGNDVTAMSRLVRHLYKRGETVLPISFHSSSLLPESNPYVKTTAHLHYFYDRLSAILDKMRTKWHVKFVSLEEIPGLLQETKKT